MLIFYSKSFLNSYFIFESPGFIAAIHRGFDRTNSYAKKKKSFSFLLFRCPGQENAILDGERFIAGCPLSDEINLLLTKFCDWKKWNLGSVNNALENRLQRKRRWCRWWWWWWWWWSNCHDSFTSKIKWHRLRNRSRRKTLYLRQKNSRRGEDDCSTPTTCLSSFLSRQDSRRSIWVIVLFLSSGSEQGKNRRLFPSSTHAIVTSENGWRFQRSHSSHSSSLFGAMDPYIYYIYWRK